ncbi:HpcH/HpaI aldolase/citrate lyase family protein [Mycolicibacterium litorale]|uniref:CoA ester lyase n=1 Tax=Mycolicibacterium litorale TaxID=758802 RepID=A0A4R8J3V1_9MYCO|nr:CoA ester lyase [Mycolicibacterium litorale]MCV7415298.1 CoA ester lyase [Mycolicibacterium litorale]TDY08552.1 citrate lyase subunit beta/citryl-CoA lyase [Mycolicibacterium litorale]BBY16478.1 CoA ester lyase [Mycolicibacterium litorale]BCI52849.1 CoA ester lyase [Mycolicibacterium litorale]
MIDIDTAGTLLFVPGDRPDRFRKAVDSGADLVVIDLEDAVPPAGKDAARRNVGRWLDAGHRCAVRINAFDTVEGDADLQWLTGRDCPVMLPKAEDARRIVERLGDHAVLALIETASGVLNAATVAAATPVRRLAFGSFDLAAHLGVAPEDRAALAAARSMLVLASAAAGLAPPLDGVTAAVTDNAALTEDIRYAVQLGFGGKLCVHPAQVPAAAAALAPSAADVAWAQRVIESEGSAVSVIDGRMVDKPVFDRARRILTAAPGHASPPLP